MTPITQTRTGYPTGNCTEAAIASLLDIALDEVPDLYDPADPDRFSTFPMLCAWLQSRGLIWVRVVSPPLTGSPPWGWVPDWVPAWAVTEHHLIGGQSTRGCGHMVVGRFGRIVWDPHPLRNGLTVIEDMTFLVSRERVPEEYRQVPAIEVKMAAEESAA